MIAEKTSYKIPQKEVRRLRQGLDLSLIGLYVALDLLEPTFTSGTYVPDGAYGALLETSADQTYFWGHALNQARGYPPNEDGEMGCVEAIITESRRVFKLLGDAGRLANTREFSERNAPYQRRDFHLMLHSQRLRNGLRLPLSHHPFGADHSRRVANGGVYLPSAA